MPPALHVSQHRLSFDWERWRPTGLRLYLLIALAIESVMAMCVLLKGKAFAFVDIGADTFCAFVPLQIAFGRQFRELGELTWSFSLGLGGYIGTLFDPFWFLTAPFPDSWQLGLRLPLYLVKLLLAGGFFYGYLRLIGFRAALAVFGGLGFAFSSYGTINAQWDLLHGVELVQFSAFLFLLEKYLCQRARWAAIGAGIVVGLGNPFGLYMFALLSLVYLAARYFTAVERGKRIEYLRLVCGFGLWFLAGLLLTAPLLFPNLYYFLESPRVSGKYSMLSTLLDTILSVNGQGVMSAEIAGLLDKSVLGIGNAYGGWGNYLEGPGFYVGLLLLLCIPQLLGPNATRRERWMCIAGLVGIALYFVFPALRYAVYGFGHMAFRFSTVWISALILVLGLAGFRRAFRSRPWPAGALIGAGFVAGILSACAFLLTRVVNLQAAATVAGFLVIYVVLLGCREIFATKHAALRILLAVFACELMLTALPPILERDMVDADGTSPGGMFPGTYRDGTRSALDVIAGFEPDGSFYRVHKTYKSVFLNDALVQDYHGIQSYFFHASSITRFIDRMGLPRTIASPNTIGEPGLDRRGALDLLGVRYFLSRDRSLDSAARLVHVAEVGGIHIYRNEAAHQLGTLHDEVASEAVADRLPPTERDALLLHTVLVDDPDRIRAEIARRNGNVVATDVADQLDFRLHNDTRIDATIRSSAAGVLLLSFPFDSGWTATLDGEPVDLMRADYGLTAMLVGPGHHELAMRYVPPYRGLGIWLCLLSMLVIPIAYLVTRPVRDSSREHGTLTLAPH